MSLVFLTHSVLSVLSEWLLFGVFGVFALSLTLCAWRAIFSPTLLCLSKIKQQPVLSCFPVSFPHGEYQVLCRLCAHMMYCDALWRIDGVWTGYCFTSAGCVFVGTGWTQWGMDHIPLHPYPTSNSLRRQSLYGMDRQLCTIAPVPLTSRRKSWLGADCPVSVQVMHNKVRLRWDPRSKWV